MKKEDDLIQKLLIKKGDKTSLYFDKTMIMLSNRVKCMYYEKGEYNFKLPYIVDILKFSTETLGIAVAASLQTLMPQCNTNIKNIHVVDILNPHYIKGVKLIQNTKGDWEIIENDNNYTLFQDERFLVVIKDDEAEIIIYCYQK